MINRNFLECDGCKARIMTRTAIGLGDRQALAFPCPACGIGIEFRMTIDQEEVSYAYDPVPHNATWIDTDDDVAYQVTFDLDYLVPRSSLVHPYTPAFGHVSPFIAVVHHFRDIPAFQRDEGLRRFWLANIRPIVERASTYFEREDWDLFDREVQSISDGAAPKDLAERFDAMCNIQRMPHSLLLFDHSKFEPFIRQRFALASSISPARFDELVRMFLDSGRILELWKQVGAARKRFLDSFSRLGPILQPLYWKDPPRRIEDYVVCNKDFEGLKTLYIEAFETLARLSVIAFGLEAIIHHRELAVPSKGKKPKLGLHDFESLPSARKRSVLKKFPVCELFSPFLDTRLRNGIGHHSARYEASSDAVVCVKTKGSRLEFWELSYTEFCRKVMSLVSRLFVCETYLLRTAGAVGGRLQPKPLDSRPRVE